MAAERGAHLMVEKPFAQSVDGVEDLLKFCDAKRLRVLTAYNWRYWPPMLLVERLLKEGRIGAVRAGAHRVRLPPDEHRYPGEDYRQFYMADARRAAAACSTRATRSTTCAGCAARSPRSARWWTASRAWRSTSDDIADLTVRFASGAVGNIHMNLFAWNMHSHFELMGEDGRHPVAAVRERDPASSTPRRTAGRSIPSVVS